MALLEMNAADAEPLVGKDKHVERTTEEMLYELFPKHVADALKEGKKVDPEHHDLVTVVFAEIVDFEELTQRLPPMKGTQKPIQSPRYWPTPAYTLFAVSILQSKACWNELSVLWMS